VGNLTTVSSSARDFTTTILGYYFAERVSAEGDGDGDLAVFLRWEQLASYARGAINNDWEFRGAERAKSRVTESENPRLKLGTDSSALILSDQKTYGLWGLFSVPARSSGLVGGDPTRVTPAARALIESEYLPTLSIGGRRDAADLVSLLGRRSVEIRTVRERPLLEAVARALPRKVMTSERTFYRTHLVEGGPNDQTGGRQRILANALGTTFAVNGWELEPTSVTHLAKRCRTQASQGDEVAYRLDRIRMAEALFAPAARLFAMLLSCSGQPFADVVAAIRKRWGAGVDSIDPDALAQLKTELSDQNIGEGSSDRWLNLASAMAEGDYSSALALLIEQNRAVMLARGGAAPWVEERDAKLHVRFLDEKGQQLPTRTDLKSLWTNSYFIDSLRTIAMQVDGHSA